ncbi:Scr1 family TA system antitoxin-like transcriptional regulator [Amycolatopsis rhabdoformis]|uniref:Scr1 family TA system antitoxin-like transcriptional regulator n=1 Tax=Amycolatopsis rhabdoformis TaxID=1448059 RepID=A0ABZ1HU98_9PSEU|nr:Scr1 family TA system antitoxin-like transcriptional regulator [Amycolatopsis rhabdoformis]WSE25993.1 Scr1 family TA system antitoxin-like transcriptional regulator [Amycolatopsis rhabdoformis]
MRTESTPLSPVLIELGAGMKAAREQAKFGVRELARRAGVPVGSLANWEGGRRLPPVDKLSFMLGLLRLPSPEYDRLLTLAANASTSMHAEILPLRPARLAIAYTRSATKITEWAPTFLPVHLQTRAYTWDMVRQTAPPGTSPESYLFELTAEADQAPGPEPAIREWFIGPRCLTNPAIEPATLSAQHEHLRDRMADARIRLVPEEQHDLPGFVVYRTPGRKPIVALRHRHTTVYLTSDDAVTEYTTAARQLAKQALTAAETEELLSKELLTPRRDA